MDKIAVDGSKSRIRRSVGEVKPMLLILFHQFAESVRSLATSRKIMLRIRRQGLELMH